MLCGTILHLSKPARGLRPKRAAVSMLALVGLLVVLLALTSCGDGEGPSALKAAQERVLEEKKAREIAEKKLEEEQRSNGRLTLALSGAVFVAVGAFLFGVGRGSAARKEARRDEQPSGQ